MKYGCSPNSRDRRSARLLLRLRRAGGQWNIRHCPMRHTGTEFRDPRAKLVAMEDSMTNLYAINLHLQERLEGDWRKEVRATEAAV